MYKQLTLTCQPNMMLHTATVTTTTTTTTTIITKDSLHIRPPSEAKADAPPTDNQNNHQIASVKFL